MEDERSLTRKYPDPTYSTIPDSHCSHFMGNSVRTML